MVHDEIEKSVLQAINACLAKSGRPANVRNLDESLIQSKLLDSIALVELIFNIEDLYRINSAVHRFNPENFETPRRIVELILSSRSNSTWGARDE